MHDAVIPHPSAAVSTHGDLNESKTSKTDISRTTEIKIAFADIIKTLSLFMAIMEIEIYLIIIVPVFYIFY